MHKKTKMPTVLPAIALLPKQDRENLVGSSLVNATTCKDLEALYPAFLIAFRAATPPITPVKMARNAYFAN